MNQEVHYALIPPANLDSAWVVAAPWLIQAIGESDSWVEIDTIKENVRKGAAQLWLFQDKKTGEVLVTFITEAVLIGGLPSLVVRWLGGAQPERWISDIGIVERWAANNGFHKVEAWGRAGWGKLLQPHGYRESFRVFEKLVDRGIH